MIAGCSHDVGATIVPLAMSARPVVIICTSLQLDKVHAYFSSLIVSIAPSSITICKDWHLTIKTKTKQMGYCLSL